MPRPPKAAPNSKRFERESESESERGRASANFAALEDVEARSLVEAYGFKVRIEASGDVAARLERERASIPVSEPVHAGKRTDKTGMRAGLDRISAYRHVPRSTSRVTLPTRTTPRRSVRPVGDPGTRRCDADQDPCVRPSRSRPPNRTRALPRCARTVLSNRFTIRVINSIRTNTRFVYISANGTETHRLCTPLPSPVPGPPSPSPRILSFAREQHKFPRQQLLKLISR